MDIIPTDRARVFGCQRCGGIWLDGAATEIAKWAGLHAQLFAATASLDALEMHEQASTHAGNYRESPRRVVSCPICQRGLKETTLADTIQVDVCSLHGTFFDRRELHSLHDAVSK